MANSAPTLTGALDKASYAPGDTITATLTYGDPDSQTQTLTWTATDGSGATQTLALSLVVKDPVALKVTDPSGRVWTKVSDNGVIAVFTAKA